jgi:uncharacterized protein YjdB
MSKKVIGLILLIIMILAFSSCGEVRTESITLSNSDLTLSVGDTSIINVTVNPPLNSSGLVWSSSNEKIATVDNGTVKAKAVGKAVITVMSDDGVKESCNVTVEEMEITSVSLDTTTASVKSGKTIQLNASITPSDASTDSLQWTSSDNSLAIVDNDGYVTALKKGTVLIKCTAPSGKSASCTLKIEGKKKKKSSSSTNTTVYYYYGNPNAVGTDYSDDFVFYDSSVRYLDNYEVADLSSDTIQQAINEIYARNGYVFSNKSIREYYENNTSWYKNIENKNFSVSDFNEYEKKNLALLQKYR